MLGSGADARRSSERTAARAMECAPMGGARGRAAGRGSVAVNPGWMSAGGSRLVSTGEAAVQMHAESQTRAFSSRLVSTDFIDACVYDSGCAGDRTLHYLGGCTNPGRHLQVLNFYRDPC